MTLLGKIFYKDVRDRISVLLESAYWEPERIRAYQLDRLRSLVDHASRNVPYYRSLFRKHGISAEGIHAPSDFSKVPVLGKRDIQLHVTEMTADGTDMKSVVLNSTGGSTGMPVNFYQDRNFARWSRAARLRAWRYVAGGTEVDLEAVLWGDIRDVGKGLSFMKVLRGVVAGRSLALNTFDLDDSMLRTYLRYYNLLRPRTVRGYATSLYYVALYAERNRIALRRPKAVVSSAEVLHPRMRRTIERAFGCRVFDSYGCREVSQIATECEVHDGLHIVFENQYVELDGQDILVTNLNNYVMPLIRYRVGDLAESIDHSSCACGRHSPRLVGLIGRDNDDVELPSGKVINEAFFEHVFFGIETIIQYQVVFHRKSGRMVVKLHLRDDLVDAGEVLRRAMLEKFGFGDVDVEYGDTFDRTPTGKLRFVYAVD